MARPQVVHIDRGDAEAFGVERAAIAAAGADLVLKPSQTPEEIMAACAEAAMVIVERASRPFTRAMMSAMPRCRGIFAVGVGYDGIDVAAATDLGIVVCNAADYCTEEVADHTVALILGSVRRILPMNKTARSGAFVFPLAGLRRVRHLTLGLLGLGRIARSVAQKMAGFRMRILAAPRHPGTTPPEPGVEFVGLDQLLRESDIVSIHLPLTAETKGLIGEAALRRMKPSAILVNTGRGRVVDQEAMMAALREGRLAGAALDVMAEEPLPVGHPLAGLDNVLLTPHYGGVSEDSERHIQQTLVDSVTAVLRGDWPPFPVNPAVQRRRS